MKALHVIALISKMRIYACADLLKFAIKTIPCDRVIESSSQLRECVFWSLKPFNDMTNCLLHEWETGVDYKPLFDVLIYFIGNLPFDFYRQMP